MTPASLRPLGPFARAVREALESVVSPDRARTALVDALTNARVVTVPEELDAFTRFATGPLDASVRVACGPAVAELVRERIQQVLWMATTATTSTRPRVEAEQDDRSGEHPVELPLPPVRRSGISDAAREAVRAVHEAKTQPPPPNTTSANASEVSAPRREPTGPRPRPASEPTPSTSSRGSSPQLSAPLEVLVVTLDPTLVAMTQVRMRDRARVTGIADVAELTRAISRATSRITVVIDTAVASIDMPTFASLSDALPAGTTVVLWGTTERQKVRLASVFPCAVDWIASDAAESPSELIDRSSRPEISRSR